GRVRGMDSSGGPSRALPWEQTTTLSPRRIWPIVAVRPTVEVAPIVSDANQRPAVSRNDDVRTCSENSVDGAALEAELAQVGSTQYCLRLLESLRERRLHAASFSITCWSRRFAKEARVGKPGRAGSFTKRSRSTQATRA